MNTHRPRHQQRGVSLVELMIAMLLGLFLMIGVIQVFVSSKSTYNTQESLSRVQESGRHAIALIARDLRMAGYSGCGGQAVNVYNHLDIDGNAAQEFLHDFTAGIYGSEAQGTGPGDTLDLGQAAPANNWLPDYPDGTGDPANDIEPLPGSDVIMVRTMSSSIFSAEGGGGNPIGEASQFGVIGNHDFVAGEILVVSDCVNSTILQIGQMSGNNVSYGGGAGGHDPGNKSNPDWQVEDHITGDASVGRVETSVYFVALNDEDVPTLYRQLLSGNTSEPQAIAEGVENMQVLYGVRDGPTISVGEYLTAEAVDNANRWDDVIVAEVALLVSDRERLPEGIADRARTFTLAGYDLTVEPDGLQRQIFRARVTLRNRAL